MPDKPRIFRTLLGTLACLMLLLHIVLASVIVFRPEVSRHNSILSFYRRFVVLGPFFQESRIVAAQHLAIRAHVEGAWSPASELSRLSATGKRIGKYEGLQRQSFENFLADRAARARRKEARSRAVRELEGYLRSRPAFAQADSLDVSFIRRSATGTGIRIDTVFSHKFKR